MPEDPEIILYNPNQLAEILGLHVDVVRKKLASGDLPGRRTPQGRWLTSKKDLLIYLESLKKTSE